MTTETTLPITLTLANVLDHPEARRVVERHLPTFALSPHLGAVRDLLLTSFLRVTPALRDDAQNRRLFWAQLEAAFATPPPVVHQHASGPSSAPSPAAAFTMPASEWAVVGQPTRWGCAEIALGGPADGNPFLDVDLVAEMRCGERSWTVGGFYDGNGVYRLRALAEQAGGWTFTTRSNAPELDGLTGEFTVGEAAPGAHGPVRVDGFHFRHADGTRYRPWGTTAYAWIYETEATQAGTLATLGESAFNKLRMCLFPKHFIHNSGEPTRFPFPRRADGSFDLEQFDTEFFRRLDEQVRALGELGVEADLILFHPYDRWGFSDLGREVDERLLRYVVRRLAGYANVWWSMANEYDLLKGKTVDDWHHLGRVGHAEDPHGHLLSIHNFVEVFDHCSEWISHVSLQCTAKYQVPQIGVMRDEWGKPVVLDECGYEGNLEWDWGNLTGQEMLRRCWESAVRGGYAGHGETFYDADDAIWWSKGGQLHGESHRRIAFLDRIVGESPTGVLEPIPAGFDGVWAGAQDKYLVTYFGATQPHERHVLLPPGQWVVEVLDTWGCTVDRLPGVHSAFVLAPLPSRPYMAVRAVLI